MVLQAQFGLGQLPQVAVEGLADGGALQAQVLGGVVDDAVDERAQLHRGQLLLLRAGDVVVAELSPRLGGGGAARMRNAVK